MMEICEMCGKKRENYEMCSAIHIFTENIERTNMLITAMEKIKIYNRIYQMKIDNYELFRIRYENLGLGINILEKI